MSARTAVILMLSLAFALSLSPIAVYAGGDQNTNRGSEGQQIGEPAPEPSQDPEQPRTGDPNPDTENMPSK